MLLWVKIMRPKIGSRCACLPVAAVLAIFFAGCSPAFVRPDLYPNDHLRSVGSEKLEKDIAECNDLASTYVSDADTYDKLIRDMGVGSAVGAGSGVLAGVITDSSLGRATAAGAAVGAIIPILQKIFTLDQASPNREKFVAMCLTDRGYLVL